MAQVRWINSKGGSWQTGTNWSTGAMPGSTDDAIINAHGSYTVTSATTVAVNSMQLISTVTLDIVASSFSLTNGTGAGVNAGTIIDDNSSTLSVGGTLDNTGIIRENSVGNTTDMRLASATVTLDGGGHLTMSDNGNNRIFGNASTDTLINVDNVISGGGQLGVGQMALTNERNGVIDATGTASALVLNTGSNIVINSGLIEATASGGLVIQSTVVDDTSGGTIAAAGSKALLELTNSTIRGGTLSASGGGVIETAAGNGALDGTAGVVTIKGTIVDTDNTTLSLSGTINNTGTISEASTGDTTDIRMGYPTVVLEGGGAIVMSNNINNRIFGNGSGYQLTNVDNTISGAGQIGVGQLTLTNETKGVIDANQTTQMVLNTQNFVNNTGTIEATGTGGLLIQNTGIVNTGGTIKAAGKGSHVDLSGSTIEGGTVSSASGGVVQTVGGNAALDGLTSGVLTLSGTLLVNNNTTLTLDGTINNKGTISEAAGVNTTDIRLGTQVVTLQGGGNLTMTDSANNRLFGNSVVFQLNNVDNTISGAGQIGVGNMQLSNSGTIDATGTNAMVLNFGSYSGTNNAGGLIEATGAGGMMLQSGIFTNNGTLEAANGSSLTLQSSVFDLNTNNGTLSGGVWEAAGNGTLAITGGAVAVDAANIILSGATSTFETGDGNTFANIGTSLTTIASGGQLSVLSKASLVATASSIADGGTITLSTGGTLNVNSLAIDAAGLLKGNGIEAGSVADDGNVIASGGTLDVTGGLSGKGVLQIGSGATAIVGGGLSVASVAFASGKAETLGLGRPGSASSTISGFAKGDVIDLVKTGATSLSYKGNTSAGVLTVKNGTGTVATLNFTGNYTTASFSLASDNSSGTKITETGAAALRFIAGSSQAAAHEFSPAHGFGSGEFSIHGLASGLDAAMAGFGWSGHGASAETFAASRSGVQDHVSFATTPQHESWAGVLPLFAPHANVG